VEGATPAPGHLVALDEETTFSITQRIGALASFSFLTASGADASRSHDARADVGRASFDVGGVRLDVSAGAITEEQGVLGLAPAAALRGAGEGLTKFVGIGGGYDLGEDWTLGLSAEFGRADFADGWLEATQALQTTAFSVNLRHALPHRPGSNGRSSLDLAIAQPVRVEGGALSFAAPVASRYGINSLHYEQRTIDPSPTGREIRAALAYRYWSDDTISAHAEIAYVSDPGHVADREDELTVYFGARARFPRN
jgi:hypothetical protein